MNRLTIFAKGNLDVRDTLHSLKLGGAVVWNGIGDLVRERHPGWSVRIRHEVHTRSDALAVANGVIPAEVEARAAWLTPYTPSSQFSPAVFDGAADAIVLSIQSDLMSGLLRHRRDGYMLHHCDWDAWPPAEQDWLRSAFERSEALSVAESMRNFEMVIERIRAASDAPILIYNVSSVIPGEKVHVHMGLEDILSTRIRQFNLGLIELSQRTGISVIDVDAVLARAGAERLKLDTLHLTGEGCRLVADEVLRVLEDLGLFPDEAENRP